MRLMPFGALKPSFAIGFRLPNHVETILSLILAAIWLIKSKTWRI